MIAAFDLLALPDRIIVFAIGGVFIFFGLIFLHLETRARRWPKCSGVMIRSTTKKVPRVGPYAIRYLETVPEIEYKYDVGDYTYHGKNWSFSNFYTGTTASKITGPGSICCLGVGALVLTLALCIQ